jgi:hypothetical protein
MKGAAIVGLLFAAYLYIGHVERSARADQKRQDEAAVKQATLQAHLAQSELARAKEARSAANTRESNDALVTDMVAARRLLDAHLARLRDQADQGGPGAGDMPSTADAASLIDRADRVAVMAEDYRICTDNTVRLVNGQNYIIKEYGP